ncbi:MAG TPA: hypothetical protein VNA21_12210 [Steroidobacteraceae bacterium]|nr:hypothetical protein [Steroidobacteraceae bacterium]
MGLSETILAAMIGAIATVSAAIFQIFSSIKSRNKIDVKPRKGSTMRSMLAVLALMIASAVGGFLYSELLKQRDGEDMRAMRMELRELKELTAAARAPVALVAEPTAVPTPAAMPVKLDTSEHRVESVAYVPACRKSAAPIDGAATCTEAEAQRIALCGSIPAYARIAQIELFAQPDAVQKPWGEHRVAFEQDLGGARFTGKSFEYAQGADLKAVCVNFMQWSSEHSHIARVVLNYAFGAESAAPAGDPQPVEVLQTAADSIIAADSLPAMPQQASFVTSTKP